MKFKDVSIPVIIVSVILMFILPIPGFMLDFLLAINIMLSAIILLNTIYLKDALQLSIFPSFLVFSTIFRLSLNVSSTKLILTEGKAGKVIDSFGRFVARDNPVVGFIIFLIIMIVNFLVITKGSERISEVAARFTLDAMPGKQMAIDADLNTGLISDVEAKERRKNIQREADFYGAMDGASKFVKNDAIAGIIITLLNIIGGLIVGMVMRKIEFQDALQNYIVLTVGDGLVSQIPALMISVATSFVVTRAASESNISDDLLQQIFSNPGVLYIASGMSFILSFFLARVPFLIFTGLWAFIGYSISNKDKEKIEQDKKGEKEVEASETKGFEGVIPLIQVDPIEFEFGYGIIPMADVNQGGDLPDRIVMIRRQLALEMGIIVPIIRIRDNMQLNPNEYIIKIKGVETARGELMTEHLLAVNSGVSEEEIGGIKTFEPAFGLPAIWIKEDQADKAEALGYTVVDPPSVVITHLTEIIKRNSHILFGRQEVQALIDNVKESYPVIIEELIPKLMTIGEVQKVIANLLKEKISIRDIVTILETLADYASITKDTDILSEYARQGLSRYISKRYFNNEKSVVITVDPKLEKTILDSVQKTETGSYLALQPKTADDILNSISDQIRKFIDFNQEPIILTSPAIRLYFKRLTENIMPDLIVLSYAELDNKLEIQSIGMVSV
jgi:flagellar biosynthesis protein FlhA